MCGICGIVNTSHNIDENILKELNKPSIMTQPNSIFNVDRDIINGWKKYISKERIKKAFEIMSMFGLEKIYSFDSKPNLDTTLQLMK